jgi:molecular chaperone DnaK
VLNLIAGAFQKEHQIDLRKGAVALTRIREAAEIAKIKLSTSESTKVLLPFICETSKGQKHLKTSLTRGLFEKRIQPLVERCRGPILLALEDARLKPEQVDRILMVGGSTHIPAIQQLVRDIFGKEPLISDNAQHVVAMGAAIQGSVLAGEKRDTLLIDVTPLTLGIETEGGVMSPLIERNAPSVCRSPLANLDS